MIDCRIESCFCWKSKFKTKIEHCWPFSASRHNQNAIGTNQAEKNSCWWPFASGKFFKDTFKAELNPKLLEAKDWEDLKQKRNGVFWVASLFVAEKSPTKITFQIPPAKPCYQLKTAEETWKERDKSLVLEIWDFQYQKKSRLWGVLTNSFLRNCFD